MHYWLWTDDITWRIIKILSKFFHLHQPIFNIDPPTFLYIDNLNMWKPDILSHGGAKQHKTLLNIDDKSSCLILHSRFFKLNKRCRIQILFIFDECWNKLLFYTHHLVLCGFKHWSDKKYISKKGFVIYLEKRKREGLMSLSILTNEEEFFECWTRL